MRKIFSFLKTSFNKKIPNFRSTKKPTTIAVMDFNFIGAWHYLLLN